MAHLKHSGPVRQAAHAKRTALVEILTDEPAANDDLSEADLLAIDLAFGIRKQADPFRRGEADRAQGEELQRLPLGGFIHG
jgi:hypothetical protein